ncbi:MAG: hypothetical protein KG075_02475 [Alphaproteobacteria bacterium]|nr:hypothetical protein [Alphaproteobacteria bacterium]
MFSRRRNSSSWSASLVRPNLARLVALLALFALTFHGLLPLTHQVARQVQEANGIEQIVLCSALGFRTIAMKDGAPVDPDPSRSGKISKSCPVCLTFAGLQPALLPPVAAAPAMPATSVTVLYGAAASSTLAQAQHLPQQARAPPALSLT